MNILITYDFLTTESNLGKSLSSKLDFFKEILVALGQNVVIDDYNYKTFSIEKLSELENYEYKKEIYNSFDFSSSLNIESKAYIESYIEDFDLLITYELSKETRTFFDSLNIVYIDLWMSPIRFYNDVMFSFYSNNKKIKNKIKEYRVSDEKLYTTAKEIENYCKYLKKDNINLENGSALIIGQLFQDKAILKDGIFLNLLDFKKEIKEFSKQYKKLYFLKHPLMKDEEFKTILTHFSEIKNMEYLSNANIYSLLSKKEIVRVIAISSSVLYESVFFGKEVEYLYQPVLNQDYINIYNEFYTSEFWNDIFELNNDIEFKYLVNDNFLRYRFNAFYAYDYFNKDSLLKHSYSSIVSLYDFCERLDKNKDYVLYGYGSVGKIIAMFLNNSVKAVIDKNLNGHNKIDNYRVIESSDLLSDDNVIITPFLYSNEIKNKLSLYKCKIIEVIV